MNWENRKLYEFGNCSNTLSVLLRILLLSVVTEHIPHPVHYLLARHVLGTSRICSAVEMLCSILQFFMRNITFNAQTHTNLHKKSKSVKV